MKVKLSEAIKINQGLWIPDFILRDNNLTLREKTMYSLICNFNRKDKFFMSNKSLSLYFGISEHSIQKILDELEKKRYIKRTIIRNKDNEYVKREIEPVDRNINIDYKSLECYIDVEREKWKAKAKAFFDEI